MAFNFFNPSRSYDASRHCVCLWGCDNAREITFQVDGAVLSRPGSVMGSDEPAVLAAFTYPCRRQCPLRWSARRTPEEHHARH